MKTGAPGRFTYGTTCLVVGSADLIIDSARAAASKLEAAGYASVELFVSEEMTHEFYFFPRLFREEEAYNAVEEFLQKHLAVRGEPYPIRWFSRWPSEATLPRPRA